MPTLRAALAAFFLASLQACSDDGTGGTGGDADGGGGASTGGANAGGEGGAGFDCEAIASFDDCRAETLCLYIEAAPECPGQSGVSGCFWASCDDCADGFICEAVVGGDGADGCTEATSCLQGD